MKNHYILVLLITVAGLCSVSAQEPAKDNTVKENKKNSYFKAGVTYLTNAVYNGRKDSLVLSYITPSLGYYDRSGFYISGSLSYLSSSAASRIDLFSLTTGYDFTISPMVTGGIYASKDFYTSSSSSVRSETKGSIGGNLSYDPGVVTLNGGINLLFSDKTDVSVSGSLAHSFYFGEKGNEWSIAPTLAVNIGTQNYYQAYIKNRTKKKNGSSGTVQVQNSKFTVLDYELSLPIAYDASKWGIFLTPTYAIPQSPASYTVPGGSVFVTEKLENVFYAELGVYLKF